MAPPANGVPGSHGRRHFNFTAHIRRVCEDMVGRVPQLGHIDLQRVAIGFCQTRSSQPHGLQATLTPLRFEGGVREGRRDGRRFRIEQLRDSRGQELLYILSFYLPRFLNHPLQYKIETVLHELWHIGPRFDGDLRRFEGRCYAHGPSQRAYDAQVARLAQSWWQTEPAPSVYSFLRLNHAQIHQHYGPVVGVRIRAPKLIPLED